MIAPSSMSDYRTLIRDCNVTLVPSGEKSILTTGTEVYITHRLGGNFTVTCSLGMFRIAGSDADAIGEEISEEFQKGKNTPTKFSEEAVWQQLKLVYDPEIPVNIVDLGLVYSLDISDVEGHHDIRVAMTLTAPGCGMGPVIADDAKTKIEMLPNVANVTVEIVWDPPWTQDMISEAGKMELGLI